MIRPKLESLDSTPTDRALAGDLLTGPQADEVAVLLAAKGCSHEMGEGARRPVLDAFIVDQLGWARDVVTRHRGGRRREVTIAAEALFRAAILDPTS